MRGTHVKSSPHFYDTIVLSHVLALFNACNSTHEERYIRFHVDYRIDKRTVKGNLKLRKRYTRRQYDHCCRSSSCSLFVKVDMCRLEHSSDAEIITAENLADTAEICE